MNHGEMRPYTLIDLFSGVGGMTLGFARHFKPVWANDNNVSAAKAYALNFGVHCSTSDILDIVQHRISEIPKADIVIGGIPCQGFSVLNKRRHPGDPRRIFWRPYLQVVEHCGARVFVIENVPPFVKSEEYRKVVEMAQSLGFRTYAFKLCAADYGVPQLRRRAFVVGCRFADPSLFFPPLKTHYCPDKKEGDENQDDNYIPHPGPYGAKKQDGNYVPHPKPWRTVRDAIGDLPSPQRMKIGVEPPLDLHFRLPLTRLSRQRYRAIPKEGMNWMDLRERAPHLTPPCRLNLVRGSTSWFGRLWWDRPASTIVTAFYRPESGRYIHPSQHRTITHREAARLQSFPDTFKFFGSKIEVAKQIGNAVPPLLAERIADCVYTMLGEDGV